MFALGINTNDYWRWSLSGISSLIIYIYPSLSLSLSTLSGAGIAVSFDANWGAYAVFSRVGRSVQISCVSLFISVPYQ